MSEFKIRKFTSLASLKSTDKGSGTIEGYRSVKSIDEGADLILDGAYRETISDYLSSGFSAESHNWSFADAVGFPVEAREDSTGFWVKSQFHSTPDAQNVRQKAKERMQAGKTVGFSIGYAVKDYDYIEAKDYERELPKLVKPQDLAFNMAQAKRFPRVRVLKKLEIFEDSIVTAPMNRQAVASGVKSARLLDGLQLRNESQRLVNRARITLLEYELDQLDRRAALARSISYYERLCHSI